MSIERRRGVANVAAWRRATPALQAEITTLTNAYLRHEFQPPQPPQQDEQRPSPPTETPGTL